MQKHGATSKPMKPAMMDVEDKQKMAKVGLEMKLLTSEVDAEAEKWDEYAENDIVKRAKSMSSMAYNMCVARGSNPRAFAWSGGRVHHLAIGTLKVLVHTRRRTAGDDARPVHAGRVLCRGGQQDVQDGARVQLRGTVHSSSWKWAQVPGSAEKNDLLAVLEKIPVHCQQLQVLVKSPTVGKHATFTKVCAYQPS